jgi:hypothetical protein
MVQSVLGYRLYWKTHRVRGKVAWMRGGICLYFVRLDPNKSAVPQTSTIEIERYRDIEILALSLSTSISLRPCVHKQLLCPLAAFLAPAEIEQGKAYPVGFLQ